MPAFKTTEAAFENGSKLKSSTGEQQLPPADGKASDDENKSYFHVNAKENLINALNNHKEAIQRRSLLYKGICFLSSAFEGFSSSFKIKAIDNLIDYINSRRTDIDSELLPALLEPKSNTRRIIEPYLKNGTLSLEDTSESIESIKSKLHILL